MGTRRRTAMRRLAVAISAAVLLASQQESAREVGFVESFEGAAERYAIERAGERLPVFVLAPLHQGDLVRVGAQEGRIALRLGTPRPHVVDARSSPFRIEAPAGESSLVMNVARWLGEFARGGPKEDAGGVSLVTRSVDLRAPLLAAPARLAAGPHPVFALAWSGGSPPYAVRVASADGAVLLEAQSEGHALESGALDLAPGTLTLSLRDALGATLEAQVDVLAAPPPPAAGGLDAMVDAARLAAADGGAWRLEAYQRASAAARDYGPARVLADALAAGAEPPALEQP